MSTQSSEGALVRAFRVQVTLDELRAVEPLLEEHVARFSHEWRTVLAHWVGVRRLDDGASLAIVTAWESRRLFERVNAGSGARAARHGIMGDLAARGVVEDFDLVDQLASSFEPGVAAVLRLVRLPVRAEREQDLMDLVQPVRDAWAASGELAVTQVARREDADGPVILVIALWRTAAGLTERRSGPDAAETPPGLLRAPAEVETFDLLPISALRLAPSGPAVVVSNDSGSIVDITPAAASLLGRDPWDVLGQPLDAFEQPAVSGRSAFSRPEGGHILLHARELRDTPAPGRHALVLVPGILPEPSAADVRAAVTAAYRWSPAEAAATPEVALMPEAAAPANVIAAEVGEPADVDLPTATVVPAIDPLPS